LFEGKGVRQDQKKATEIYQMLADESDPIAQANLGFCLHDGRGINRET
jgi:TPR repeat protein